MEVLVAFRDVTKCDQIWDPRELERDETRPVSREGATNNFSRGLRGKIRFVCC